MIITKKVSIYIKGISIKYYKDLGYNIDTKKLNIIKVEDLPKCSQIRVDVKCDNCGKEKNIRIQDYYRSYNNDKYTCIDCSRITYKNTMLQKYGVENSFQLNDVKNKSKETKIKLYNNKNYNNRNKSEETCMSTYGVKNPQQNKEIKEKTENTNLKKYGFKSPAKNNLVQEKSKNFKKEKYNDEYFNNHIKFKKTMMKKYGVDNPMKYYNFLIKSQKNALKRLKYKNTNLYYQGTYELDFLLKYFNKLNITPGKLIKIVFENKNTIYYSDFFIPNMNLIVEIKSSYWYNKYLEKNIIKQIECEKLGYNYIIIIDKNYKEFEKFIMDHLLIF